MAEEVKNEAVENDSPQLSLQDIATMVQVTVSYTHLTLPTT